MSGGRQGIAPDGLGAVRTPSGGTGSVAFVGPDGLELTFREPRRGDADGLMRFINSVIREPMSGIVLDEEIGPEEESEWLERRLTMMSRDAAVDLLVEGQGRILGNCDIVRRTGKERHRADMGIALAKEVRGKGVGKALMRSSIALAKDRMPGLESLWLSAFSYNRRAIGLYESLGFVEVASLPKWAREGEEYHDEVLLVLDLAP